MRPIAPGSPSAWQTASCRRPRTTGDVTRPENAAKVDDLIAAAVFVGIVVVVAVVGVRLGMLVAPRIDRLTDPHDEADGDQHD